MIDTVIFDFDGVIAEPGFRIGLAQRALSSDLTLEQVARQGMRALLKSGYVTGQGSEAQFWAMLTATVEMAGSSVELREAILASSQIRQPMLGVVKGFRDRGLTVALLSDHTDWLDQIIADNRLDDHFDFLFNSYHLQQCKRDELVFDRVARLINATAEHSLFIDDNPANVERAVSRGFSGIVYQSHQQLLGELSELGL